jgi:2-polyprenyl-3-methyl-5-hydroxy-6-metoxy-1,4-benzoquinol methylase
MPNLKQRSSLPEKMDASDVPDGAVRKALRELELINRWLGGYNVTIHALESLKWREGRVKIMDVGSGGGDTIRAIAKWAEQKDKRVELVGIDINPAMTRYASKRSQLNPHIHFRTADVFDDALLEETPDIVMCNLFAHHFDGQDLVALIKRMHQLASNAIVINDLHRHPIAYHSIRLLTRVFSRSHLVKYDGPLSVARSLRRKEWLEVLGHAGITQFEIQWRWAWRWEIVITK